MIGHRWWVSDRARKLWLWAGLVLGLAVIACGVMTMLAPPGRGQAAHNKIRAAATIQDVEAILGDADTKTTSVLDSYGDPGAGRRRALVTRSWTESDGLVWVTCDQNGAVLRSGFTPNNDPSPLRKFRNHFRSWFGR